MIDFSSLLPMRKCQEKRSSQYCEISCTDCPENLWKSEETVLFGEKNGKPFPRRFIWPAYARVLLTQPLQQWPILITQESRLSSKHSWKIFRGKIRIHISIAFFKPRLLHNNLKKILSLISYQSRDSVTWKISPNMNFRPLKIPEWQW